MYCLIIIIIIIIFLIAHYYNKKITTTIEGYDDRKRNMSFLDCAEFCKTTENCYAFGYDEINKICYPSQTIIAGRPTDSIFRDEFLYTNATCNKYKPIINPSKNPPFDERRSNSVYICRDAYNKFPQFYFYNNRTFKNMGEGKNIDEIFDVESYSINPYTWPRNKYDCNNYDLLFKAVENQTYNKNNVTDLNHLLLLNKKVKPLLTEICA
jgi:hypothetical protein